MPAARRIHILSTSSRGVVALAEQRELESERSELDALVCLKLASSGASEDVGRRLPSKATGNRRVQQCVEDVGNDRFCSRVRPLGSPDGVRYVHGMDAELEIA